MKKILKFLTLLLLFIISFIVFLPKENLYYLLEKKLLEKQIIIFDEQLSSKLTGLTITNAMVSYQDEDIALFKSLDIETYFGISNVRLEEIALAGYLKTLIPSKVQKLDLQHSLLEPQKIKVIAKGEFGEFTGEVLFLENRFVGELHPSKLLKSKYRNLLREFQLKEGRYLYELQY